MKQGDVQHATDMSYFRNVTASVSIPTFTQTGVESCMFPLDGGGRFNEIYQFPDIITTTSPLTCL